ncbi:MAG: type III-A CRISPR-associated protein Csm2 [Deltaproteobacteria bacterium]|nr:type III-A CRISPR-associated protein Csm2 [Deltaproteobacteria bacterium]
MSAPQDINFWEDKKNQKINPKLFSDYAESLALSISKEAYKNLNKRTQIRKFYDEIQRLNEMARSKPGNWDNIMPYVQMVTAKAAYARGRELISDSFLKFIKTSINQVENMDDLRVFNDFFEAFMGFYRLYGPAK